MATMALCIDTSEVSATIAEIAALFGDGSGRVPADIEAAFDLVKAGAMEIVEMHYEAGTLIAKPSPALSALAHDLWALRGYGVAV